MRIRPPHAPNSLYHVTLRGNRQQPLFHDTHDRSRWQQVLSAAMQRYGSRLHLYCWMTNHIHMLLQCGEIPIFKTLHWAGGAYARIFNTKYEHAGHLFQGRYGSKLVDTDPYLLQLIRYIHINPVTAGIVGAPDDYRWSSYRAYAHALEPEWLTSTFVLKLFGDDPAAARSEMVAFTSAADDPVAVERSEDHPIIETLTTASDLDELRLIASRRFAIELSVLSGPSRGHRISKARAWIAWTAQQQGIATLRQVANCFDRHPSALSRCLARHKAEFEHLSAKQVNAPVPGTNKAKQVNAPVPGTNKATANRRGAPSGSSI
jgi:REP element-mobilizing transposase RayT